MTIITSHLYLKQLLSSQAVEDEMLGSPVGINVTPEMFPRPTLYHSRYQGQMDLIRFTMWEHCEEPLRRSYFAIRHAKDQVSVCIAVVGPDRICRRLIIPTDRDIKVHSELVTLTMFLLEHAIHLRLDPQVWI